MWLLLFISMMLSVNHGRDHIGFHTPQTPEELLNFLNVAMTLELSTIPLYMTAMLSFKNDNMTIQSRAAKSVVLSVMMDEMLHMAELSNIISSIFGTETINICYNIMYGLGAQLPGHVHADIADISLRPYSKESLWTFIQIESPSILISEHQPILLSDGSKRYPFEPELNSNNVSLTFLKQDRINTIGEFYNAIQDGLIYLTESEQITFSHDDDHIQRECQEVEWNNITRKPIISVYDAIDAIDLIKHQGEGYELEEILFAAVSGIDDDSEVHNDIDNLPHTGVEKTHFVEFIELLVGRKLLSLQHIDETTETETFRFIFDDEPVYKFNYKAHIFPDDHFKERADPLMFNGYYQEMLNELNDGLKTGDIYSTGSISTMYLLQQKYEECMENGVYPDFSNECDSPPKPNTNMIFCHNHEIHENCTYSGWDDERQECYCNISAISTTKRPSYLMSIKSDYPIWLIIAIVFVILFCFTLIMIVIVGNIVIYKRKNSNTNGYDNIQTPPSCKTPQLQTSVEVT